MLFLKALHERHERLDAFIRHGVVNGSAHTADGTVPLDADKPLGGRLLAEQVVKLGERKRAMFDQMITAGEAMPTQLTPEDIRALFD